jgi:glutamate N-acetyltransferase/amino-acid N-acetyltransferase
MPSDSTDSPSTIPALPRGYRFAGVRAGIKHDKTREDVSLIVSDLPAAAAGVYTTNLVFAAPVAWDRGLTPGGGFRAVAINSGNANACTGQRGLDDARAMAATTAAAIGADERSVLVLSTGIIGEFLPMAAVTAGLEQAAAALGSDATSVVNAARGMMTTDTRPKLSGSQFTADGTSCTLLGLAKGAAMIGPRLATMLGVVVTDAAVAPADAQRLLQEAAEETFNCVSVDGHTSTNDTVLLLANGAAGGKPLSGAGLAAFAEALHAACEALAREIADDGEGATHVLRIEVSGWVRAPRRRPPDRPGDRRQSPREDGRARSRPQLGPDRVGGRLRGGGLRSRAAGAPRQRDFAFPRRRPRRLRRGHCVRLDQGFP